MTNVVTTIRFLFRVNEAKINRAGASMRFFAGCLIEDMFASFAWGG
jgi:hypothetical protein